MQTVSYYRVWKKKIKAIARAVGYAFEDYSLFWRYLSGKVILYRTVTSQRRGLADLQKHPNLLLASVVSGAQFK